MHLLMTGLKECLQPSPQLQFNLSIQFVKIAIYSPHKLRRIELLMASLLSLANSITPWLAFRYNHLLIQYPSIPITQSGCN